MHPGRTLRAFLPALALALVAAMAAGCCPHVPNGPPRPIEFDMDLGPANTACTIAPGVPPPDIPDAGPPIPPALAPVIEYGLDFADVAGDARFSTVDDTYDWSWSEDGTLLAINEPEVTLVWEVATGRLRTAFRRPTAGCLYGAPSPVWSPDATRAAMTGCIPRDGGRRPLYLVDLDRPDALQQIDPDIPASASVRFSRDGSRLLAEGLYGGDDLIWEIATRRRIRVDIGPGAYRLLADGVHLLDLWPQGGGVVLRTITHRRALHRFGAGVVSYSLSRDESRIAVMGDHGAEVFALPGGSILRRFPDLKRDTDEEMRIEQIFQLSPDGSRLLVTMWRNLELKGNVPSTFGQSGLELWDVQTGQRLWRRSGEEDHALHFSGDGRYLDFEYARWGLLRAADGSQIVLKRPIRSLSPDSRWTLLDNGDYRQHWPELAPPEPTTAGPPLARLGRVVARSRDGTGVVSIGADGSLQLERGGACTGLGVRSGDRSAVAFAADGRHLLATSDGGSYAWGADGTPVRHIRVRGDADAYAHLLGDSGAGVLGGRRSYGSDLFPPLRVVDAVSGRELSRPAHRTTRWSSCARPRPTMAAPHSSPATPTAHRSSSYASSPIRPTPAGSPPSPSPPSSPSPPTTAGSPPAIRAATSSSGTATAGSHRPGRSTRAPSSTAAAPRPASPIRPIRAGSSPGSSRRPATTAATSSATATRRRTASASTPASRASRTASGTGPAPGRSSRPRSAISSASSTATASRSRATSRRRPATTPGSSRSSSTSASTTWRRRPRPRRCLMAERADLLVKKGQAEVAVENARARITQIDPSAKNLGGRITTYQNNIRQAEQSLAKTTQALASLETKLAETEQALKAVTTEALDAGLDAYKIESEARAHAEWDEQLKRSQARRPAAKGTAAPEPTSPEPPPEAPTGGGPRTKVAPTPPEPGGPVGGGVGGGGRAMRVLRIFGVVGRWLPIVGILLFPYEPPPPPDLDPGQPVRPEHLQVDVTSKATIVVPVGSQIPPRPITGVDQRGRRITIPVRME